MKYAKVKELSFKHYPRLYLHEDDLLHHLFFVNGNGYHWFNGELAYLTYDSDDDNAPPREVTEAELIEQVQRDRETNYKNSLKSEAEWKKIYKEVFGKDRDYTNPDPYYEDAEQEIDYRISSMKWAKPETQCWFLVEGAERNHFGHVMYPIYDRGAMIMNLPDDIKPDWLDAAERAIQWAESPYCRMTEKDRAYVEQAKIRIAQIKSNR